MSECSDAEIHASSTGSVRKGKGRASSVSSSPAVALPRFDIGDLKSGAAKHVAVATICPPDLFDPEDAPESVGFNEIQWFGGREVSPCPPEDAWTDVVGVHTSTTHVSFFRKVYNDLEWHVFPMVMYQFDAPVADGDNISTIIRVNWDDVDTSCPILLISMESDFSHTPFDMANIDMLVNSPDFPLASHTVDVTPFLENLQQHLKDVAACR